MPKETNKKINFTNITAILIIVTALIGDFILPEEYSNSKQWVLLITYFIMLFLLFIKLGKKEIHIKVKEILDWALGIFAIKICSQLDLRNIINNILEFWPIIKFIAIAYFKIKIATLMVQYFIDKKIKMIT